MYGADDEGLMCKVVMVRKQARKRNTDTRSRSILLYLVASACATPHSPTPPRTYHHPIPTIEPKECHLHIENLTLSPLSLLISR